MSDQQSAKPLHCNSDTHRQDSSRTMRHCERWSPLATCQAVHTIRGRVPVKERFYQDLPPWQFFTRHQQPKRHCLLHSAAYRNFPSCSKKLMQRSQARRRQTVVALKPKRKQRSCKSTHRRDQRTDGLLRHREHPLVPLESCSDTQGSAESSPRDRSNMRPSIEPCDESSLDFFAEHPQAYCGHRHALAHTITDANYTQKHHAEAESTPLTRRSEK